MCILASGIVNTDSSSCLFAVLDNLCIPIQQLCAPSPTINFIVANKLVSAHIKTTGLNHLGSVLSQCIITNLECTFNKCVVQGFI